MSTQQATCVPAIDNEVLDRYTLIPALFVVCVLHGYQYYKERKLELIPPFLSLIGDKNKKMIAVVFGAITSSIFLTMLNQLSKSKGTTWGEITLQTLMLFLDIAVIAAINYPMLMCFRFPYKFIASVFGEMYTLLKFIFFILNKAYVKDCHDQKLGDRFVVALPNIICFLVLIVIYGVSIVRCIRQREFGKSIELYSIACDKEKNHVRKILGNYRGSEGDVNIFRKFVNVVKGISKLSTIFVIAIVVILTIYYYITVIYLICILREIDIYFQNSPMFFRTMIAVSNGLGISISTLVYLAMLFHMVHSHEQDLRDMFAGKTTLHGAMVKKSPRILAMKNIVFPGFLVAYMVWSFFWLTAVLTLAIFVVYLFIYTVSLNNLWGQCIIWFLKKLYQLFLVPAIVYVIQWLMTKFLFCERNDNNSQLVMLRHVKLYHFTIYVNFFCNILMGVFSCIKRSLIGFLISFLFLGRIDRTSFAFFKRFDSGYQAYIGFMRYQALYRNPVMRCFVQILIDSMEVTENEPQPHIFMEGGMGKRKVKRARNRWHLAYTLIRNPHLVKQRVSTQQYVSLKNNDFESSYNMNDEKPLCV